jgi:hexulose-6-phosphate isomerase
MENSQIGFMQGRLSPIINGKIQEFPWNNWKNEFSIANEIGFTKIEWTLDQHRLYENPLLNKEGQFEINNLQKKYRINIPSLTGDCFMQSPFWKLYGQDKLDRQNDFFSIINACEKVGIAQIVIPLVDNGSIKNNDQLESLLSFLSNNDTSIHNRGIEIIFESDFSPENLKVFIDKFDEKTFGINYDIGNSSALGFDPDTEFLLYGNRILNVHVKDRKLNGTTISLGDGDANFDKVFNNLKKCRYCRNYILQTARAHNGDDSGVLIVYKAMVEKWILNSGS